MSLPHESATDKALRIRRILIALRDSNGVPSKAREIYLSVVMELSKAISFATSDTMGLRMEQLQSKWLKRDAAGYDKDERQALRNVLTIIS